MCARHCALHGGYQRNGNAVLALRRFIHNLRERWTHKRPIKICDQCYIELVGAVTQRVRGDCVFIKTELGLLCRITETLKDFYTV